MNDMTMTTKRTMVVMVVQRQKMQRRMNVRSLRSASGEKKGGEVVEQQTKLNPYPHLNQQGGCGGNRS